MNRTLLPLAARTHSTVTHWAAGWQRRVADHVERAWAERADETGIDEAVTKMIWLAVGIGVALAATAFFTGVFQAAQANVPDPITP